MKRSPISFLSIVLVLTLFCATPHPYRLQHAYSVPQALRFVRQVLLDQDYDIAIFDTASGVVKTERREFTTEDNRRIIHQISVTVMNNDELLVKVLPAAARNASDEIMAPIVQSLRAMGFRLAQDPGSSTDGSSTNP